MPRACTPCPLNSGKAALVVGAALLILCGCNREKTAPSGAEVKHFDFGKWTTIHGTPFADVLNSPTNLFHGRLILKTIGKQRLLLDGLPVRDVRQVFLQFKQGEGQDFVTGDSDASQAVFELVDRLEVGKMYHLPEDIEIGVQDKQTPSSDTVQRVGRLEGFNASGIPLVDALNSPTNLFQGRLNRKRFGIQNIALDGMPPRDARQVALYFKGEDGKDFLTATSDASKDELELSQRLELGKIYRLPEDLKGSEH